MASYRPFSQRGNLAALLLLVLLAASLAACGRPPLPTAIPDAASDQPAATAPAPEPAAASAGAETQSAWWNDTVFYEVFVRSFQDSDGDGIGDLQGLIDKLDYLNDGDPTTTDDLGVTGIWLMPVAQSPSYHGYDTTDYYTIEEDYGSNEDFQRLLDEAHQRGIKVIVDLVLNHTSTEHPWFVEFGRRPQLRQARLVHLEPDRRRQQGALGRRGAGLAQGGRRLLLRHVLGGHARPELPQPRGDGRDGERGPLLAGGDGRRRLPAGRCAPPGGGGHTSTQARRPRMSGWPASTTSSIRSILRR